MCVDQLVSRLKGMVSGECKANGKLLQQLAKASLGGEQASFCFDEMTACKVPRLGGPRISWGLAYRECVAGSWHVADVH